jgi:hypothetical protein
MEGRAICSLICFYFLLSRRDWKGKTLPAELWLVSGGIKPALLSNVQNQAGDTGTTSPRGISS